MKKLPKKTPNKAFNNILWIYLSSIFFILVLFFLIFWPKLSIVQQRPEEKKVLGFKDLLLPLFPYPINKGVSLPPELSSRSVIVIDVDSSVVLFEKNSRERLFPASTTKIMTGLIALENYKLDQIIKIGDLKIEGNTIKLIPGEEITVENLLKGLLVGSGNDAAIALSENFPQGTDGFVWAMNQKAKQYLMNDTYFTNPVGWDENNHLTTSFDLARLSLQAMKNPIIADIVSQKEVVLGDATGEISHDILSTNELVGKIEGVKGIKTGWTEKAGGCLVMLMEKDNHRIVSVVLGSNDRFGESKKLADWVFENYSWEIIAPPNQQ